MRLEIILLTIVFIESSLVSELVQDTQQMLRDE